MPQAAVAGDQAPTGGVLRGAFDAKFIGLTLLTVLARHEKDLPADLRDALDAALRLAAEGSHRREVDPAYTNIALLKTLLLVRLGAEMEAGLRRDITRYYHPGLRNLCGPFDRAYGMDMTRHVAGLGQWLYYLMGRDRAPFPDPRVLPAGHRALGRRHGRGRLDQAAQHHAHGRRSRPRPPARVERRLRHRRPPVRLARARPRPRRLPLPERPLGTAAPDRARRHRHGRSRRSPPR
ncbi:MAG: hypothetical protein HOW71_26580 [Nonomuraea sp.]|nr:hypothetical protein [Nonomuraea sp.]